jgi:hypothetical protein
MGDEGRMFLPFSEVEKYLTDRRIGELLNFISMRSGREMVNVPVQRIRIDYLRVFCILLRLRRGNWIHRFVALELQDAHLPFTESETLQQLDDYNDRGFVEAFCDQQWFFLPANAGVPRGNVAHFQDNAILPITRKERLFDGTLDRNASIYKIYAHDCFSFLRRGDPVGCVSDCPRSALLSLGKS